LQRSQGKAGIFADWDGESQQLGMSPPVRKPTLPFNLKHRLLKGPTERSSLHLGSTHDIGAHLGKARVVHRRPWQEAHVHEKVRAAFVQLGQKIPRLSTLLIDHLEAPSTNAGTLHCRVNPLI